MAPCEECGFDDEPLGRSEILTVVTDLSGQHAKLLRSVPAGRLREHTRPGSWSPLEYGCHVRDVLAVQRDRVLMAQAEPTPRFVSMRREERVAEEAYNEQDPAAVGDQLESAALEFTVTMARLDEAGWDRTGVYPWPAPEIRSVEWIGRRTAHELAHHLFDNRRLLG